MDTYCLYLCRQLDAEVSPFVSGGFAFTNEEFCAAKANRGEFPAGCPKPDPDSVSGSLTLTDEEFCSAKADRGEFPLGCPGPHVPGQITLPISFHIIQGFQVESRGVTLTSWADCGDVVTILNGVNDIWRAANIRFELLACDLHPEELSPTVSGDLLTLATTIGGDDDRVPAMSRLTNMEFLNPRSFNVVLIPFMGHGQTGVQPGYGTTSLVGTWSSGTMSGAPTMRQVTGGTGSIAYTVSHELGHGLSLRHPGSSEVDSPNLMSGFFIGIALTEEQVSMARDSAKRRLGEFASFGYSTHKSFENGS